MHDDFGMVYEKKQDQKRTSSFLIAASAFALCRFSQAVILASSLLNLEVWNTQIK